MSTLKFVISTRSFQKWFKCREKLLDTECLMYKQKNSYIICIMSNLLFLLMRAYLSCIVVFHSFLRAWLGRNMGMFKRECVREKKTMFLRRTCRYALHFFLEKDSSKFRGQLFFCYKAGYSYPCFR